VAGHRLAQSRPLSAAAHIVPVRSLKASPTAFRRPRAKTCCSEPSSFISETAARLGSLSVQTLFPADYQGDLFVAFHGSWNRSVPTGYKVVRVKMNERGEPEAVEDFITGWLAPGENRRGKWKGRPVGLVVGGDGSLYISDDGSGSIYRVTWQR